MLSRGRLLLGVCLASLGLLAAGNYASAQQGKYVEQASGRLVKLINAANNKGYDLHDNKFSIGGGMYQGVGVGILQRAQADSATL